MGVVVQPSARETFTPRELAAAYKMFLERGPQYVDAETGIKADAYQFGERTLLVYEEPETGLVIVVHPKASKRSIEDALHEKISGSMAPDKARSVHQ